MIRKLLFTVIPISICATLLAESMSSTGIAGRTGAPGETNCTACHSGNPLNASGGSVTFGNPNMPGNVYTPGQTYNMSVTVARTGFNRFGIGIGALTSSNQNGGTLNITDPASTQIKSATISGVSRRNVVHTSGGGNGTGTKTFNFSWTAPPIGTGNVTFYFAGNAVNANGATTGDYVYTGSVVLTEAPCNVPSTPSTISGNPSFCSGSAGVLTVAPDPTATSYTWTLPNGWTGTSNTNSINVIAGLSSGTVTVTANNACGSSPVRSLAVTSSSIVASLVSTSNSSCAGVADGSAQVTATGGIAPYAYQWTPSVSTGASASNLSAGNYSVIITDAAGCSSSLSIAISEPTPINVQAGASQNACEGASVILGGSPVATGGVPPYSYLWNNGSAITYSIANPAITVNGNSTWQLTVVDANGCVTTGTTTIISDPLPVQPVIAFLNDSLVASSSGLLQWYFNGQLLVGETGQSLFPTVNGDYSVTVTDPMTGCSSTSLVFTFVSTGIINSSSSISSVYPNPASDVLFVGGAFENGTVELEIVDRTGALQVNREFTGHTGKLDISHLPSGVYSVILKSGSVVRQERLVILR